MSRSNALANEASHKFIDPISLDLMQDPVMAADRHSYDRQTITNWFATQRAQGRPFTSPRTNLRLESDELIPNVALKRELDIFIASTSTIRPADIQFTLSSEIFKELDRISSMSEMGLFDFEPPKIVVLGNESHGKSTILERVIGLPLFPKEKGICTRCVVRVHMRRCRADQPTVAEVSVKKTAANPTVPARTRQLLSPTAAPPILSQIVALDNIREKIKEVMDDLVRRDPQRRMIIDDHEIIVKINLPYCLNVDILDLPGLVTTSPASTTQNLPQVTKEIAMRVIGEQRESSFFLLVNDVRVPANQSRGCEVVQEAKIEGQTLGIFTKVDTFVSEDGSESAELQQLLDSSRGGFPLGYGWMAAASRSVDMAGTTNKLQAFLAMEQNESRFFREKYGALVAMNKMGIQQIRQRIQTLYESFIQDRWIPHILTKLNKYLSNFERRMLELGTPLPPDNDYLELTTFLRTKASKVTTFNEQWLRILGSKIFQKLLEDIEQELIKLNDDAAFWDSMKLYQNFIEVNEIDATKGLTQHHPFMPNPPPHQHHNRREIASSYKYGSQIFERDVPALEMNNIGEKLETTFREAINGLYKQLHDRINPDKYFVDSIRKVMIKIATQEDPQFKIERFNVFLSALVRVVEGQFNKIVRSFDDWFG
eukprot:gene11873-12949_t